MRRLASERALSWWAPIGVALFAFVLRVWHLGRPNDLLFDETYYAKDAWALLQFGYDRAYKDDVNERIVDGVLTGVFQDNPSFTVHPEVGKYMIASGEWLFGMNSFGWRISAAVVGALTVLVLARLVRRLTGSTAIGCFVGFLLAIDGMAFVMSRLSLLDGFLAFWLLCAVACLAADRDWVRSRLVRDSRLFIWRPWQVAAGVCFGLAIGTKWSALPVLALFGLAAVIWEIADRRFAERNDPSRVRARFLPLLVQVSWPAFGSLVVVAGLVYLATWTGFLVHHDLYAKTFGLSGSNAFAHLVEYHRNMWNFHTGDYLKTVTHPYQSSAWGWLILDHPVGVAAEYNLSAKVCGATGGDHCVRILNLMGNPVIWWTAAVASVWGLMRWFEQPASRWTIPVLGIAATWLPWLKESDRPIFSFYAVASLPFMLIALGLAICTIAKNDKVPTKWVWAGCIALGLLALVAFWWWYAMLTYAPISSAQWNDRRWLPGW